MGAQLSIGMVMAFNADAADPVGQVRAACEATGLPFVQLGCASLAAADPRRQEVLLAGLRAGPGVVASTYASFPGEDYTSRATIARTGGFVPDDAFEQRLRLMTECGRLTQALGATYISTHAGALPRRDAASFPRMIDRLRHVADALAPFGLTLGLETGQEDPAALADFIHALDRPHVGVNFDPANMILYGSGDPLGAARLLSPLIRQVHAKDAVANTPADAAAWAGHETALGHGDAQLPAVLEVLRAAGFRGAIAIEHELTTDAIPAVRAAASYLRRLLA